MCFYGFIFHLTKKAKMISKIDLGESDAEKEAGRALSSRYSKNVNVEDAK
ncbi:hypothetical protein X777_11720 [Ooceraea biroi]|uniref:Uncharacterized protein n=1 Tax=Ooceraea biroi TaxID=2015173 RepID=A0A026W1W2_OOCBI|nr:hypothetical protein X777_11720 [Ooceraea biroi]